jgi:hypothetical protein
MSTPISDFRLVLLLFWCVSCSKTNQKVHHGPLGVEVNVGPEPSPVTDSCTEDSEEPQQENTELVIIDSKSSFFSNLFNGFSSGITTVHNYAESAKTHLYSKISDVASDFADKVRTILKDEFWDLIANGLAEVFYTATAPGNFHPLCN